MQKKEVILITHSLSIGGAERHVINIANYLAKHDVDVTIVPIDGKKDVAYNLNNDINVLYLDNKDPDVSIFDKFILKLSNIFKLKKDYYENLFYLKYNYMFKLKEIFIKNKNAVIVSFMPVPTISSLWANKYMKNKFVFFEFSAPEIRYDSFLLNKLIHKYAKYADGIVFQTEDEKKYFDFLSETKKYIIPNPLYSVLLPEPYSGERKKVIVNFCRIDKAKNLRLLIDSFVLICGKYPEYRLHIYGDGSDKEHLKKYIDGLGLSDKAFIFDARPDIHKDIVDFSMFVSSSDYEGISNSMIESMGIGLPCICTDCAGGGARMMIEDHVNGILVPMNDKYKMAEAMTELIENPALAEKLSKNAIKIRERLNPEKICSQIMNVIFE